MRIPSSDPVASELIQLIRLGKIGELGATLTAKPGLVQATILERSLACGSTEFTGRSLLHIATDWPGHFPSVDQTIKLLVELGADVNARFIGKHQETPLHWAASCDDCAALDALLDGGADINATEGVIAGGTPLMDATAFGQWKAARRLVERGAAVSLWDAAALGLLDRAQAHFREEVRPDADKINSAFWGACHGGQLATAEFLLQQGADLNWVGYDRLTPLDAAVHSKAESVVLWLRQLGARATSEIGSRDD
jgi:uncharacterized protein